jgi:hypothetical protein
MKKAQAKTRFPELESGVSPLATKLRQSAAASIGRTIARHSYMQWRQAKILYTLLGISIKQGRAADIRVPGPSAYIRIVKDLLLFHRAQLQGFKFGALKGAVEDADRARNILAHSVFLRDKQTGQLKIQIVRGSWELEHDVVTLSRALQPEGRLVDRAFLNEQRAAVETGILGVEALRVLIEETMRRLNALREGHPQADRRKRKP